MNIDGFVYNFRLPSAVRRENKVKSIHMAGKVKPVDLAIVEALRGQKWNIGHCVYLIQEPEGGPVKVGHASNPYRRIEEFQSGNHRSLVIKQVYVGPKPYCQATERRVLEHFKYYRIREWLRVDAETVVAFMAFLILEASGS